MVNVTNLFTFDNLKKKSATAFKQSINIWKKKKNSWLFSSNNWQRMYAAVLMFLFFTHYPWGQSWGHQHQRSIEYGWARTNYRNGSLRCFQCKANGAHTIVLYLCCRVLTNNDIALREKAACSDLHWVTVLCQPGMWTLLWEWGACKVNILFYFCCHTSILFVHNKVMRRSGSGLA